LRSRSRSNRGRREANQPAVVLLSLTFEKAIIWRIMAFEKADTVSVSVPVEVMDAR
jgi:hypothetical protein